MSRHKKKIEKTIDITSFFRQTEQQEEKREKKEEIFDQETEKIIYDKIRNSKKISRSKLYEWSKNNKIPQATLYRILQTLIRKNMIKRQFSDEDQEIVFIAS